MTLASIRRPVATATRPLCLALLLATLCASLTPAHATYPGENGPIVFDFGHPRAIGRVQPGNATITTLSDGYAPRVSPNGRQIAFLKGQLNTGKDVYVMNIDGTRPLQLTNDALARGVTWSPDGSYLAYVTEYSAQGMPSLWTMRADGSDKRFVRTLPQDMVRYSLDWSPTGHAIAYVDLDFNLWVTPLGGGLPTLQVSDATDPSWAPDGSTLMYRTGAGWPSVLMSVRPFVTPGQAVPSSGPTSRVAVSPDSTQLAGDFLSGSTSMLSTLARDGGSPAYTWPVPTGNADWARVPKNCFATSVQGGGGVLAGDVNFYAEQCAIAVSPSATSPNGVVAQALAVGPDRRVYIRSLHKRPFGAPVWNDATVVPGVSGHPDGVKALKVAVAAGRDGSYQVVIVNADDKALYHAMQYPNGLWSGFNRLDGWAGSPGFQARDVAIAVSGSTSTSSGNLQVLANDLATGEVFHRMRVSVGIWTPFAPVPAPRGMNTQALAIASSDDRYTNVLAISTTPDGKQGRLEQVVCDPNGNWGSWVAVPLPNGVPLSATSDVAVARTSGNSGVANLMVLDSAGKAWFQVRRNPNQTGSWQGQEPVQLITTNARSVSIASEGYASEILVTRTDPQ